MNRSIVRVGRKGKRRGRRSTAGAAMGQLDSLVELIQALIALGLEAVNELLQQEDTRLVMANPGTLLATGTFPRILTGRWG